MSLNRVGGSVLIPTVKSSSTLDQTGTKVNSETSFVTGVVKEYFSDPQSLSSYDKDKLRHLVRSSNLVDRMPINSIHCVVIENGRRDEHVAYPFFSQHLCVPVKPGEQVWLVREGNLYYWFCRKTGDYSTEDLNYTHIDRGVNQAATQVSARQAFSDERQIAEFPNGITESETDSTLGVNLDYNTIIRESQSYNTQFVPTAVPRLTKKPGDLLLQGSNNTAILLGDRDGQGEIKIISGRKISSNTVTNARNYEEIDKSKSASSDSINDDNQNLSSINLSMSGNVDVDFGINIDGINQAGQGAGVVIKSDQIRLIARQDIKITVDNSGAGIVIKSNGEIVIVPSTTSVIKLGGDDANKAILCQDIIPGTGDIGNVQAPPVVSTMGGVIGSSTIPGTGLFASKVLVK